MSDLFSLTIWWLTIFVTGLICFPFTSHLFRRFFDRGYIFTKVIGIITSSYLLWLLGSLHLLPFTRLTILIVLIALFLTSSFFWSKKREEIKKLPLWIMIFEEILFFLTLAFWSYVRASEPSIRGLEKFMDFGFVNSILRTQFFPPVDMWLTKSPDFSGGYFINYYYFGHYITAFLTKLSGIDSAVTYNLMMATLFAFTFTLPFSLAANLYSLFQKAKDSIIPASAGSRKQDRNNHQFATINSQPSTINFSALLVGLLAGFIVSLGGNLHTLYVFTEGYPNESPKAPWELKPGFHPERYWYPNATRFIPFTIHEFPSYSFVVADLHGHVSDIPMVFLILAFLLVLITKPFEKETDKKKPQNSRQDNFLMEFHRHTNVSLPSLVFLGVLMAVMYMTNAWDGLIYMIVTGLVFLYLNLRSQGSLFSTLQKTFSASLFLLFFFLLASLPFSLNFKPFVSGIGVLCAPASLLGKKLGPLLFETGKCQKSPFYMLATLWGFFYYSVIGYFLFLILPSLKKKWEIRLAKVSQTAKSNKKIINYYLSPADFFVIILISVSTLLLIFPEFFYIKDIYPAHYRANTMFKLGYQAFMMLGIVVSFTVFRIRALDLSGVKRYLQRAYSTFWLPLFVLVAIYPYFAINSYYGNLKTYHGLYGLNWMQNQFPDDYQTVKWLRENIPANTQPVIVEANGDSYTDFARVSANTGLPTIIGWPVHEWLWRGSYDEAGKRIPEVAIIYESQNLVQTKEILRKYNVEYIFVGALEREKYKNLNEEKLASLGKIVFQNGNSKIYKVSSFY